LSWIGLDSVADPGSCGPTWLRLPAHGHDLNPVEQVSGNLKNREHPSLCPSSVEEAAVSTDVGLTRTGGDPCLCFSFLKHCGISL